MSNVAVVPAAVVAVPQSEPTAVPAKKSPWVWAAVAAGVALLLLAGGIIAYLVRQRDRRRAASFAALIPAGARVVDGTYLIRWGPMTSPLYLATTPGTNTIALVPKADAQRWTLDSTGATVAAPGGRLTSTQATSTGAAGASYSLSVGNATALPASLSAAAPKATDSYWVAIRPAVGGTSQPAILFNTALGGCVRPASATSGSAVSVEAGCPPAAQGWYFDPPS